jgi:signal transduction histidine kinase
MLRNLLDNAVKFSPPSSTVTLSTAESEAGATISITNPGAGISEEKLRDLFLLQKDKSEPGAAGEKGIGLGLHLVQELVQLNRDTIEILSRPDADTEVLLTLPANKVVEVINTNS